MAALKSRISALNGVHTAGIFADITVDGPEIGTLVVIVDRAKNLPSRKTIGKQDPYCAARLGKEAKKTETDRRGGQTPRWDQELRYTVHDSPDYYQLKVSVFNDDKKTDLIGETWVDLKEVVVPGGGQNDLWHSLNCKGKYAGEIRIEITYYDSRPKPEEKPSKKKESSTNAAEAGARDSLRGPRQPKAAVKRRPLPSDPVTGEPAPMPIPIPSAIPDHVQTPPRVGYHPPTAESVYSDSAEREYREPPSAVPDFAQTPSRGYQNAPNAVPDHVQTPPKPYQSPKVAQPEHVPNPPRGHQNQPSQGPDYVQTPPRGYQNPPSQAPDYVNPPPRGYQNSQNQPPDQGTPSRGYQNQQVAIPDHIRTPSQNYHNSPTAHQDQFQTPQRGYQNPPAPVSDHVQTPTRGYHQTPPAAPIEQFHTPQRQYQNQGYIAHQSPLQTLEYNGVLSPAQGYEDEQAMTRYGSSSEFAPAPPGSQPISNDRHDMYDPMERNIRNERNDYMQRRQIDDYENEMDSFSNGPYQQRLIGYEVPQPDEYEPPPSPGGPPPPPPAHRSRTSTVSSRPAPAMITYGSYGFPPDAQQQQAAYQKPEYQTPAYQTPPRHGHRNSVPAYSPGNYQAYSPGKEHTQYRTNEEQRQAEPRHQPYDSRYNTDYRSMQPTVEDEVPSPSVGSYGGHRASGSYRNSQNEETRYDNVPSPAPLNLSGRGSSASGRNSISTAPSHQYSSSSVGYASGTSQNSYRGRSQTDASSSSQTSYNAMPQQDQKPRRASENPIEPPGYGMPPVPATLVAGMDPAIAQEIQERIYEEKRASGGSRGKYQNTNTPQYQPTTNTRPHRLSYVEPPQPPVPQQITSYDERQSRYSMAMVPLRKQRAISPDTRRPIRKSVSPSPAVSDETRRLSGVPFGPDSYNALNPTLAGSVSTPSLSAAYDTKEVDPNAKIITYDGREIDPSDHIPEHNYAPLLESKGPKYASQMPDRNYKPPPQSNKAASNTGRRPLQHRSQRPQSMALTPSGYHSSDPSTPPTGRNRLQKKANRISQEQQAQQSSPLAPVTNYQDNNFTPRSLPRANTGDFMTNENYAPNYGGGGGMNNQHYRGNSAGAPPPIPAKVPMMIEGRGPPGSSQSMNAGGGDAWALLEEMKNIDLGSGRARRRGH